MHSLQIGCPQGSMRKIKSSGGVLCIIRSRTRAVAPQQQRQVLHAPQPTGDPLCQTSAATWQPTGLRKENENGLGSPFSITSLGEELEVQWRTRWDWLMMTNVSVAVNDAIYIRTT